jgi:hypothetical protein
MTRENSAMSIRMLLLGICSSVLACSLEATSTAWQDTPAAPRANDPAMAVNDLAVFTTFQAMIASHSFALPDDKVRDVVFAHLRKDRSQPPRTMPTPEQLQAELNLDFEASWNAMIVKATTPLDPQGKLKLENRLRDYLRQHTKLRSTTEARHDEFLKTDIPKTLERVKGQIIQEQKSILSEVLQNVVSADMPGQQLVNDAQVGDKTKAIETLAKEVLRKTTESTRETLLVESFDTLSAAADRVVSDGVLQLEEQLRVFENQPAAISRQGIPREFERRLEKIAADQKAQRNDDRLRPAYGVFSRAQQAVPTETRRWFDQRVTDCGKRVLEEFARNKHPLPEQDAETLRKLILDNPSAHHQRAASLQAVEPNIQEMVGVGQQWIANDLVDSFRQSKSSDDTGYAEDSFRQDVSDILDSESTQGHDAWIDLKNVLRRHYDEQVFPRVRADIRDLQAKTHAPSLVDKNKSWTPTEEHLLSCNLPLSQTELERLPVWLGSPPRPKEKMLQETWELWLKAAEESLGIAENARSGQLEVVNSLEPAFRDRILNEAKRTHEEWVTVYCELARAQWQTVRSAAAMRYPNLFQTTINQIDANVTKLLPLVESEQAEKQRVLAEMKDTPKTPPVPDDNTRQPNPEEPTQPLVPSEPVANSTQPKNAEANQDAAAKDAAGGSADAGASDGQQESGQTKESIEETGKEPPADEAKPEETKPDEGKGEGTGDGKDAKNGGGEDGDKSEDRKRGDSQIDLTSTLAVQIAEGEKSLADLLYRVGFWILLFVVLVMSGCWYWNVRYLRRVLAQYKPPRPLKITS